MEDVRQRSMNAGRSISQNLASRPSPLFARTITISTTLSLTARTCSGAMFQGAPYKSPPPNNPQTEHAKSKSDKRKASLPDHFEGMGWGGGGGEFSYDCCPTHPFSNCLHVAVGNPRATQAPTDHLYCTPPTSPERRHAAKAVGFTKRRKHAPSLTGLLIGWPVSLPDVLVPSFASCDSGIA